MVECQMMLGDDSRSARPGRATARTELLELGSVLARSSAAHSGRSHVIGVVDRVERGFSALSDGLDTVEVRFR